MSDLSTVQELTEVIQTCLSSKLREVHHQSTNLTLEIARAVATEVELRCKDYTNVQVRELLSTLQDDDIDLGVFREFINSINQLLDGDDSQEGFQLFNLLVTDVESNKNQVDILTHDILSIKDQLSQTSLVLSEHNVRLLALESQQTPTEIKGDVIDLIEGVFESACLAVSERLSTYREEQHLGVVQDVRSELVDYVGMLDITLLESNNLLLTCKLNLDEINQVDLVIAGGAPNGTVTFNFEKQILSALLLDPAEALVGKIFSIEVNQETSYTGVFQELIHYPVKTSFS